VTDAPREITVEDLDYLDKMAEHYGKQPSDGWVIGYDEWVMVSAAARRALSHAGGEMPKHCPDCGRMLVPFQIRSEGDLPGLPLHAGEALFVFPASQPPSPLEREREHDRQCREFAAMNPEDRHPGNEPLPLPDTPQSVPTCTCSKHPLWDGYDGDCPIHGWFEPVAPDTPQSVPATEKRDTDAKTTIRSNRDEHNPDSSSAPAAMVAALAPDAPLSQGEDEGLRVLEYLRVRKLSVIDDDRLASLIAERDKLAKGYQAAIDHAAQLVERVSVLEGALEEYAAMGDDLGDLARAALRTSEER
jgi:uncharacterized Zn finger protein (UPF0148 family)